MFCSVVVRWYDIFHPAGQPVDLSLVLQGKNKRLGQNVVEVFETKMVDRLVESAMLVLFLGHRS